MAFVPQVKIPASYIRGGTSKGVFFNLIDLPERCQVAGEARDKMLLRIIGSPDPYGKQTDGMGGATSSTSKAVILAKSDLADHDVDYLFGQVAIDKAFVDWSGNCGNLTAAVGSFAISQGLVNNARVPENGICVVRIWQKNISKTIIAHVPMTNGEVQETGDFELDGVTFPAAEVQVDFVAPSHISESGTLAVTMITAGIPTIFLNAEDIGYTGIELQDAINNDKAALARFEMIRAYGGVKMGLFKEISEAAHRQHTPKIAFVTTPQCYVSSSGKAIASNEIDLHVRALSMGKLHHAMMGTAAVAIGTAAAIPGTLVNLAAGGGQPGAVTFGHPSGTLKVGAQVTQKAGLWTVTKASMSRSARILMEGWVRIPGNSF